MTAIVNHEAEALILDLHRGLHAAMDALIENKDYDEAEVILRQMDERFRTFINGAKTARITS